MSVNPAVLKAVKQSHRMISPAQVALRTGLSLRESTLELNRLAERVNGHLIVSEAGGVTYSFDPFFQRALLLTPMRRFARGVALRCLRLTCELFKISFGLLLYFSVLFLGTIASLLAQASPEPPRLKWHYVKDCFSFLFGDGDPNADLDERRWQLIAATIVANRGTVTLEQVAPFLDRNVDQEESILPVLVRFQGEPRVTDSGNILYIFPEMMQGVAEKVPLTVGIASLLEHRHLFSKASQESLKAIRRLAIANLLLASPLILAVAVVEHWSDARNFTFSVLVGGYAVMVLLIPFLRHCLNHVVNSSVDERNSLRAACAERLLSPDSRLRKKLAEARDLAATTISARDESIAYTTRRGLLEQSIDR